ncbi:kinesin-like protein [Phytophthora cinnamomi]|uniref:kinesin-like protein n=1 Tax=Phytophthora cinnamomi TaxID=4785 RepID=UPI00355959AD|nr:kinesin-like protein [Phytophthora cinnamomi]
MKPDEKEAENIRVAVRCRPMNERENREQAVSCFTCGPNGTAVLTNVENPTEKHEFGFDFVYGCDSKQETVFEDIGMPLLDRAFGGYNGTIFAYGQTGSGKSFSMTGVTGGPEVLEGLIPRVNRAIFERVAKERVESPNKRFLVECSFFEIYNEIIYDLLDSSGNGKKNKGGLEIKEHSVLGIYVKDLQERVVETREEIVELMALGAQSRTVGYTQMNAESSRSHSIFTIKIHQKDADDETKSVFAKINLVDLAGSERAASTGAQGDRLREGANINKSLSALGNVINALVEASRASKKVFIPYRNSKLTRVLQESLGGNSLCSMLATLSPANINFAETLSTLKYASRAKSIKVNAKKNEASSQISQLNEEIAALKQKLQEQMEATLGLDPKEKDDIVKKYEKQIQEMDRVRLQTWEDKAKLSKQHEMERKKLARERALADQRIREERTKKWRLLEEKGDLELMMRALRDLDGNNVSAADATAASVAVQWLETAQKVKTMEGEAKDLRTLIQVFRDSLQKDVEVWARRCGLNQDSSNASKSTKNLLPQRREDSAAASAAHMTASQMGSKLQNIGDESEKLLALEGQLAGEQKRAHEALQQTKQQLEELATNLRAQLTNNKEQQDASQQEGQSRIAELNGELMSVRVQLDEQRRALEAAELQSKDQEAYGQQQYSLLQQTRATLLEKEAEADAKLKARAAESEAAIRALHDEHDRVKQELERALAAENLLKLAAGRLETQCSAAGAELDNWRRRAEAAEAEVQNQAQALSSAAGAEASGATSDNAESEAAARENERLLLEAQTNELRRLADLEKMEAKVQSLELELAASEEKARQTEQALLESAKRVKELEETEEELQLQLQVVTDERDSARQKEEQLFTETSEKDQEIERIRDGYVWVTDRMNSKEDELSELQEQLERYQSLLEMTGSKAGGSVNAASSKPKEDKLSAEITKLYVLAIGTTNGATGSDTMIAKLAEWIEVAKKPSIPLPKEDQPKQKPPQEQNRQESSTTKEAEIVAAKPSVAASVEVVMVEEEPAVLPSNNAPNAEEEADYDDDFDEADETDEVRKARRKSSATN